MNLTRVDQVSTNLVKQDNREDHAQSPIVIEEVRGSQSSSRRNSKEDNKSPSPERIVEVKHTSFSSNNNSTSSSECEDSSNSRRLIRRRTVRRYQRATTTEEEGEPEVKRSVAELTISINKAGGSGCEQHQQEQKSVESEAKSLFRTRQIGSYYAHQQQQEQKQRQQQQEKSSSTTQSSTSLSSSSSKIAKCSITTNRKSTTISESSSSSSSSSSNTAKQTSSSLHSSEQQQMAASSSSTLPLRLVSRTSSPLELRLKDQFKNSDLFDVESTKSIQVEEEQESSVHHRESFSSTTSLKRGSSSPFNASNNNNNDASSFRKAAAAASAAAIQSSSSSCQSTSQSRHSTLTNILNDKQDLSTKSTSSSSSSSRHFKSSSSSSYVLSKAGGEAIEHGGAFALNSESLFSSPDVRSLVREIGTDFAELENAVSTRGLSQSNSRSNCTSNQLTNGTSLAGTGNVSNRLFGRRFLSPIESENNYSKVATNLSNSSCNGDLFHHESLERGSFEHGNQRQQVGNSRGDRIKDLLSRAESFKSYKATPSRRFESKKQLAIEDKLPAPSELPSSTTNTTTTLGDPDKSQPVASGSLTISIEKIDQKMSDLCKKFDECNETKKAIELLKLMIQMIEKAWSVPVCGDDLGFRLCNSLRVAGGLDVILSFIQDADNLPQLEQRDFCQSEAVSVGGNKAALVAPNTQQAPKTQLRLNLSKVNTLSVEATPEPVMSSPPPLSSANNKPAKDSSDSEVVTSELGLDSTSVESLSYASAAEPSSGNNEEKQLAAAPENSENSELQGCSPEKAAEEVEEIVSAALAAQNGAENLDQEEAGLRKEELVFLSAKLLSQCLTSDNRDYIVANGLNSVIKLACNFTTMKSSQSQQLLSRSMIMRQSSTAKRDSEPNNKLALNKASCEGAGTAKELANRLKPKKQLSLENPKRFVDVDSEHSVVHAIIGTEILQHLFKHSEDTGTKMISLGALQAVLYACRSSNAETLRHCASALANLALYGGPEIQQTMIELQAHHWLFPLAFNEDDNVQYYACLAIVVLAANQEIEADVQESGTLDLVEPFVTLHEPQRFAESTTAHIHGQSANWLRKLVPLLESRRIEARSLACFHFAMEAYIKKEQGQTQVFKEIGAVEILRKIGSSPINIISKFSCQALRLIGEQEPHRLSQHVPKWTCEDVVVWVCQIGFDKYQEAFIGSHVDGDLLLQLDEEMLRQDIKIENGIIRRKFLRELSKLKQIADYSSVDKTNLSSLLKANGGNDFVQYIYMMIQLGVTSQNIHWLDSEQLLRQCKISNAIHQLKLAHTIKNLQSKIAREMAELGELEGLSGVGSGLEGADGKAKKTLDVFISYRRSNGSQLASLLKVHLQLRHFSVFIDVERLEAGKFDNNLLDSIKSAKNFILVLSPNALDRCIGDLECKDWVHKEIVAALASNCNIIPIMDNFHWPDADQLPEDMRSISYFNGVRWIHDYQDACVDKIERFIRGELINGYNSCQASQASNSSAPSSLQRNGAVSTPNVIASVSTPSSAATHIQSSRIPAPPFDSDLHPLSFASHYHHHNQQHSQPQTATSSSSHQPASIACQAPSAAASNHRRTQL